jgi:hypothetical protein
MKRATHSGHPQKQAIAAAMHQSGKSKKMSSKHSMMVKHHVAYTETLAKD